MDVEARLCAARAALADSQYDAAWRAATTALRAVDLADPRLAGRRGALFAVLGHVSRDKGHLVNALAFYRRGARLAEAELDRRANADCAVGRVVTAQIGADRSTGAQRRWWLRFARESIHVAAAPAFRAADPVMATDLSARIAGWYAAQGAIRLAQAEYKANILPIAAEFEDRGLLLAYLLGNIRMLTRPDAPPHTLLVERYLDEAERLRRSEVQQPLRLMQFEVTRSLAHFAYGEYDEAERRLGDARRILDRCGFENAQYARAEKLLERIL